jgi:hypothetical protein
LTTKSKPTITYHLCLFTDNKEYYYYMRGEDRGIDWMAIDGKIEIGAVTGIIRNRIITTNELAKTKDVFILIERINLISESWDALGDWSLRQQDITCRTENLKYE